METLNYFKSGDNIFLSLSKGDYINSSIELLSASEGIGSAWINGIGAFENPEIGYYSIKEKKYYKKKILGEYEITSLIGNITLKDSKPFSHTHITFSGLDYKVYGGHLFDAKIIAAGEFMIQIGSNDIHRKMNKNIGLPLWCLEE